MINLTMTPQQCDKKIDYNIDNDILSVTVDGIEEIFDFTNLSEGVAEIIANVIIIESLPINPILALEKVGTDVNINVVKTYSEEEKSLYEGV